MIYWKAAPSNIEFLNRPDGLRVCDTQEDMEGTRYVRVDGYSELIPSIEIEIVPDQEF